MNLPQTFLDRMKQLLGGEYEAWLASYASPAFQGLRINRAKLTAKEWERIAPFPLQPVPWTDNGYYCGEERPSRHPYYYAGL